MAALVLVYGYICILLLCVESRGQQANFEPKNKNWLGSNLQIFRKAFKLDSIFLGECREQDDNLPTLAELYKPCQDQGFPLLQEWLPGKRRRYGIKNLLVYLH